MKYRSIRNENDKTNDEKANTTTTSSTICYLNRFMESTYIVAALYEATYNNHICKLVVDGIDFNNNHDDDDENENENDNDNKNNNDSMRILSAMYHLWFNCTHDWDEVEFKSCKGPLHSIITSIFFPYQYYCCSKNSSSSSMISLETKSIRNDENEKNETDNDEEEKINRPVPPTKNNDSPSSHAIDSATNPASPATTPQPKEQKRRRIMTIHKLSLIITDELDPKVTLAIAQGLASTNTITNTSTTTPCIRKLVLSASKVLGVNMMAIRHGLEPKKKNRNSGNNICHPLEALSFTTSHLEQEAVTELAMGLQNNSNNNNNNTEISGGRQQHEQQQQQQQHCGGFLKKLDLFSCNLSDDNIAELVMTLQRGHHPIEELDLGKNQCGTAGLTALGQLLLLGSDENNSSDDTPQPKTKLKWLNLFYQQSSSSAVAVAAIPVVPTLQRPGGENIETALEQPPSQHQQQQSQPPVNYLNIALLTNGLAMNTSLITLILRGNPLCDVGMKHLSLALEQNRTLQRLNLTDCCISRQAIQFFIDTVLATTQINTTTAITTTTFHHPRRQRRSGIQKLWLDGGQSFGSGSSSSSSSTEGSISGGRGGGGVAGRRELLRWLNEALQSNMILEELYLPFGYFEDRTSSKELSFVLDQNRGGRRLIRMMMMMTNDVPNLNHQKENIIVPPPTAALWPYVLERVNHFQLFMGLRHQYKNEEEFRKTASRRASVMYSLLRGHVLLQTT